MIGSYGWIACSIYIPCSRLRVSDICCAKMRSIASNGVQMRRRVIVFIDDLDRCSEDSIMQVNDMHEPHGAYDIACSVCMPEMSDCMVFSLAGVGSH